MHLQKEKEEEEDRRNHLFNPWLLLFKTQSQQGGAERERATATKNARTPAKLRGAASYQNNESMNIRDSRAETSRWVGSSNTVLPPSLCIHSEASATHTQTL